MLELKLLGASQYPQVAEWEFGKQGEDVDWSRYLAEMSQPQWTHFGIYRGDEILGCVSFEQTSYNMAEYHVVTNRHKVHPRELANLLLNTAGYFFSQDFTALTARIPIDKPAASRLALRCGMREWGKTPELRLFILTQSRYSKLRN